MSRRKNSFQFTDKLKFVIFVINFLINLIKNCFDFCLVANSFSREMSSSRSHRSKTKTVQETEDAENGTNTPALEPARKRSITRADDSIETVSINIEKRILHKVDDFVLNFERKDLWCARKHKFCLEQNQTSQREKSTDRNLYSRLTVEPNFD